MNSSHPKGKGSPRVSEPRNEFSYLPNLLSRITRERMGVVDKMSEHELSEQADSFIDSYLEHYRMLKCSKDKEHIEEKKYFSEDT